MDANFFASNRFHMSLMTAVLFDSQTYLFALFQIMIMLVFHYFLGKEIGKFLETRREKTYLGVSVAVLVISSWVYVQGVIYGQMQLISHPLQHSQDICLYSDPFMPNEILLDWG